MKNIVKILIFVVAIIAVVLSVWFAGVFDQDKLDKYNEVMIVNENNPEMIADFQATTTETLPEFVGKYRTAGYELADELKTKQVQKDILYTYIVELRELTAETFPEYQANFADHSKALFAKADNAQAYIDGFNGVSGFDKLNHYISTLEDQYNVIKQEFIEKKSYNKAYNSLVNQADAVDQVVSETKKAEDLATLKADVKQFIFNGKLLNVIITLTYVLFFITILLLVVFAVKAIFTNIKSSTKTLVVLVVFAVVVLLGYLLASSELTPSAIKMQLSPNQVKWIGAGMFVFYVAFFGAICAVIYAAISGAIKNRK
jgi:hypothetical protein